MLHILTSQPSIADHYLMQMRSESIQKDKMRFRKNLERLSEVMGYEVSKMLRYETVEVTTPLGVAECKVSQDQIVVASILRAGLPMHHGLLNVFDEAENAFITAYRSHHKDGTFDISLEYTTSPDLNDKVLILADPMLATGASLEKTLEALAEYGTWKTCHIITAIASAQGVSHIQRLFKKVHLWVGAIDEELTAKSYIVPGLGDAGDLAFGSK